MEKKYYKLKVRKDFNYMFENENENENEIEFDRTCQNCSSFFQDSEDMDFGICLNDKIFEPYIDEIFESDNFSSCHELYLQKRYIKFRDGSFCFTKR